MGMLKYRDASGQFVDLLWPIGSIYCSTKPGSPAGIYGGTWGIIIGAVLRGNAQSGVYSGSDTHTLTVDEIPPHRHLMPWGTVVPIDANKGNGVSSLSDWGGTCGSEAPVVARRTQLCNAPTTSICGNVSLKYSRWS